MKKKINLVFSLIFTIIVAMIFATVLAAPPLLVFGVLLALALIPKPKGVLSFNFGSLEWAEGTENMGGLKTTGYFAPIADVDNFPALPENPSSPEEEVTLESVTGFTFLTGKCFLKMYSTQETAEVTDTPQGEVDGQSFVQKATAFFPGTKAEALAFAKQANNANMVFIFEEASGGNRRVIGSPAFPAKVKVTVASGKATADRKGCTIEITSYGITPAPLYNGPIPLTPAA